MAESDLDIALRPRKWNCGRITSGEAHASPADALPQRVRSSSISARRYCAVRFHRCLISRRVLRACHAHSVYRTLQAAARSGNTNGYAGGSLSQKLAQLNTGGGGGERGSSRLGGARTFEEIAGGRAGSRGSIGGSGSLIGGLTRSMPTLQPLRGTQRASSRSGVSGGRTGNHSSSSAARSGPASRSGPRQQRRLAFGEPSGGGEFRASIGGTGGGGRRGELSPIGSNGGGGKKRESSGGGVAESASVGAMPFLNAR